MKHGDFKRCDQSGFCKRNRQLADDVLNPNPEQELPTYSIQPNSVQFKGGQLKATITKTLSTKIKAKYPYIANPILPLTISFLDSGLARVSIDEDIRQKGDFPLRHDSQAKKQRYNEAAQHAIVGSLKNSDSAVIDKGDGQSKVSYGQGNKLEAIIQYAPFSIEILKDGERHLKINDRGFMNVEHWRPKLDKSNSEESSGSDGQEQPKDPEDESTWWDEVFNGNTDTKPKGPESIAMDVTFDGYEHVYGIPEHTGPLSLRETRGENKGYDEPYRMYNADVFEYELDSPMTLYGSIPFMQGHRKGSTVGIFWLNAAETWVDIEKAKRSSNPLSLGLSAGRFDTKTHWISESGIMDIFIFTGANPHDVTKAYGALTGYTELPQSFSIAYHQCRWNYESDDDVRSVNRKFDKFNIPYDVIWLDVEFADHRKYFEWNQDKFPDPIGTQKILAETERKMVIIVDPHVKAEDNYYVDTELKAKQLGVLDSKGQLYHGHCWPGDSHYMDCFNPATIEWWKSLFKYDKYKGTSPNIFIWNDMNEPSVFNGVETTMQRDNLHHGNWEHRDVHNINGMTYHNATYQALLERKKGEIRRPFVLTRSFYAGSQRYGAMWTGDNQAEWSHLQASIPMILSNGIAGYPFAGADVGGFFGNPSPELQTRWYQAGIFYPFFRAHAHIDSRRREPYLRGEPYTSIMTQAVRLRYQLLPAWYTAFHEASVDGSPIVRPQYYVHPTDEKGFPIDDQLYIGSTGLLAKPITTEGTDSVEIYLSDDEKYYDYFDYQVYHGAGKHHQMHAPLEKIPLLMQGGHIIPRKDRPRKSSGLMKWDPYTLVIVPGKDGRASGTLYIDDGETFDYQQGAFIHRNFTFEDLILKSSDIGVKGPKTAGYLKAMERVRIERVVIVDPPRKLHDKTEAIVKVDGGKSSANVPVDFVAQVGKASWAAVRDPGVTIGRDWKIEFS